MTSFQIIVTGLFVALIVIGIGAFSLLGGAGGGGGTGQVIIWGTLEQSSMETVIEALRAQDPSFDGVRYAQRSPATYEQDLINAIASGQGPDLVFMRPGNIGVLSDKVLLIPYSAVSQSDFLSSYIEEGRLFLVAQGALALPLVVDPLVMYWNRDLFASGGLTQPPQTWNEFLTIAPKITSIDLSQGVRRSAVAMGTWNNVRNAKAILSTLFMQTGDFITERGQSGALVSTFGTKADAAETAPAAEALRFYTEFANPSKTVYSWNRGLRDSQTAFVAGEVGVYFGFASEYSAVAERNPNLRFGVAPVPQLSATGGRVTYGNLLGVAVSRGAQNSQGALVVARALTSLAGASAVYRQTGLPPARRDTAFDTSVNAVEAAVLQSAIIARGWADPNSAATDRIFQVMIESVASGKQDPSGAVNEASQGFRQLLPNI